MTYIARRFSHEKRVVHFDRGDPTLTLDYNYLLNSGSSIQDSVVKGPTPTFTRSSNAMAFDSAGNLAYAPHNLLENARLKDQSGDPLNPSGWSGGSTGDKSYVDEGDYFETTQDAASQRPKIGNVLTSGDEGIVGGTVYTVGAYVSSFTGGQGLMMTLNTGGTDGVVANGTFDGEGWYAVGSLQGAADTTFDFQIGLGLTSNDTGTMVFSRPFVIKGLLPGVVVDTTGVKLSGEPLGRWLGTDDGDEPRFDQPRYSHDPDNSNAQLGLLFEQQEINLCLQSSTFGTTWSVGALNVDIPTTNNGDIFGTSTADEIATTNTADEAYAIFQDFTGLSANAVTCCAVHVKTGTNVSFVQLAWDDTGGGADGLFCNFQLTGAGTAGTVTALAAGGDTLDAFIHLTTDGFYRCVIVGEIDVGTVGRFTISMVDRIDAAVFEAADLADNDSIIVCAADVQVGIRMTSHIPTTTASVTRAADFCSTTDLSFMTTDTHTFICQYRRDHEASNMTYMQIDQNDNVNHMRITGGTGGEGIKGAFRDHPAGEQSFYLTSDSSNGTTTTVAVAIAEGDQATSRNSDAIVTATKTGLIPFGDLITLRVGAGQGGLQPNAVVGFLRYHNVRKSNEFLGSETA